MWYIIPKSDQSYSNSFHWVYNNSWGTMMKNLDEYLQGLPEIFIIFIGVMLVALIGYIDYLTGPEIAFSLLYLSPIFVTTWLAGRTDGLLISFIAALTSLFADISADDFYSHPVIPYWNAIVMMLTFFIFTYILSILKDSLDKEKSLSRTDPLTGAMNRRSFYELAEIEINRSKRYKHPFAVAYLDLDNFKLVNDRLGHAVGDKHLRTVSDTLRVSLRNTDIFARLGGDEFIILLTETGDISSIRALMGKIQDNFSDAMKRNGWSMTFSMGVIIYSTPPSSVDHMIDIPDRIMYSIKNSGKNMIKVDVIDRSDKI